MTPTPTDVGTYRNTHAVGGEARAAAPLPMKGKAVERDDTSSVSSHGGGGVPSRPGSTEPPHRGRPPPITTSLQNQQQQSTGGGGPGNMPSGISVQELKQMTALRMAHEQAHLRASSPFASGESPFRARKRARCTPASRARDYHVRVYIAKKCGMLYTLRNPHIVCI